MSAIPDGEDWARLIEQIRAGKANRDDWTMLRACFGEQVLVVVRDALDSVIAEAGEIDLTREIERGFWKQCRRTCETLPSDRAAFEEWLVETACKNARHVASEYRGFLERLEECQPEETIQNALKCAFPDAEEKKVEGLDRQVFEQMWHSRHKSATDCKAFNKNAFELACATGSLASTVVRYQSGDGQALEELFARLRPQMVEICKRTFPRIPPDAREDIVQDAALKLLRSARRAFQPERVSTWTAFARTVVFNAGIDWLNHHDDHA